MMFRSETDWFKMKSGDSSIWYKLKTQNRTLHPTLVLLDVSEHTQTDRHSCALHFNSKMAVTYQWVLALTGCFCVLYYQGLFLQLLLTESTQTLTKRPYVCRYRGRSALIADIVRYSLIYEFCKRFNHIGVNVCFTGIAYL